MTEKNKIYKLAQTRYNLLSIITCFFSVYFYFIIYYYQFCLHNTKQKQQWCNNDKCNKNDNETIIVVIIVSIFTFIFIYIKCLLFILIFKL